ncbi:lysosome membrane protein 2 [Biomphalaria glabrata]|nr:lysosome membrane protein 2 [Biomphalaria glabrata]
MATKKCVGLIVCGVLGVLFLAAGCSLLYVFDSMIHSEVKGNLPLKNGSDSFKNWQSPRTPIKFQIWIFNVTNHDEIIQGRKPHVQQHGPYTYREHREKIDIKYFDNGTVTYRELRSFVFDRENSVGSEDDTYYTVNLPAVTIMDLVKREYTILKKVINVLLLLLGERLFIPLSVNQLMWGYEDNLLKTVKTLLKDLNVNVTFSDEFGLFYNQNNTDDGLYEIYSGIKSMDNFGQIISWNYLEKLNYWTSDVSNMINGTDGTIYPPFIAKEETKYLFSSDLCRSLGMDYTKDVTVKGIGMDRFVAPDIMFGNVTVNPYNAGFCTPKDNCLPSGLLNVSVCRSGAPVIMSMPHFLGCDQETVDSIHGLSPNREEHQSYIDIEPMTGVAMNVGKRLQINTYIQHIEGFSELANITSPIFMPVIWLNESAVISDQDASDFKSQLLDKITLTTWVKYGLIGLGAFMILCVVVILVSLRLRQMCRREEEVINTDDTRPLLFSNAAE